MSAHESQTDEVNEVTLVGRLSQPAEEQTLPSGDGMWKFRVIVGRQRGRCSAGQRRRPRLRGLGEAPGPVGRDLAQR